MAAIAANTEYLSKLSANKIRSITPFQFFGSLHLLSIPYWWAMSFPAFIRTFSPTMEVDYTTHDLCFPSSFIWIHALRHTSSNAIARLSRALSTDLSINHHPRVHWWFRIIPVPTFQMLVLVVKTILRSIGVFLMTIFYANNYLNTLFNYGVYMIFGANTFTYSDFFIGDLLAFWGLQNGRFKAMVEWFYKERILHEPNIHSFKDALVQIVPILFLSKVDFVVASCGASCTGLSTDNDTFVSCQFKNETLIHGISLHLSQAGYSPQASSKLASVTFISVAICAAFFTISILCFAMVNLFRSPVMNGHLLPSMVVSIWKGWSQIA